MWQPDGWDVKTRLGLLVPHADVGPESEIRAMAPEDVAIHATRVPFGAMSAGGVMDPTIPHEPVRAFATSAYLGDAAALLADAPVDAIGFAFTSSAYLIGESGEAEMIGRLQERTHGIPVVASCTAAIQALRHLAVNRIALVSPPWFDLELDQAGRTFYETANFEVVQSGPCYLPSGQSLISPESFYDFVSATVPDSAEAVVIGGNGFRAVGVIDALEQTLERSVLTANQVLLWAALQAAHRDTRDIEKYGRLFKV